ncbi:DUF4062 domain-containing protein [Priestia megaterium]|uniref:DUF4062 domain-containing protein n=1 Tax=Priestia megaterium TaxID=1404 RepID=UPI003A84D3A7
MKKLQIFVSSTYEDLKDERQKAVEGILRAGHIPAGMELFTAGSQRQWDVIEEWIKESDVLMLIMGGKYGSIEPTTEKSYTEMEYRFAIENNIPVFAIVLDDQFLANKKSANLNLKVYEYETDQKEVVKYEEFKTLVKSKLVRFISNIDQITSEVILTLGDFIKNDSIKYSFKGWVRPVVSNLNPINNVLSEPTSEPTFINGQIGNISSQLTVANPPYRNGILMKKDEELLTKIIGILEQENFIDDINYMETHYKYDVDMKRKIEEFIDFGSKPSQRFFNDEIDQQFNKLMKRFISFSSVLSRNFFPLKAMEGSSDFYLYPNLNIDFELHISNEDMKRYNKHLVDFSNQCSRTIEVISGFIYESQKALYK